MVLFTIPTATRLLNCAKFAQGIKVASLACAFIIVALLLGACGDDPEPTATPLPTNTPTPTSTPTATPDPPTPTPTATPISHTDGDSIAHTHSHASVCHRPDGYDGAHSNGLIVKPFPDSHAGSCGRHHGHGTERHGRGRDLRA